jgi:hypothetical protein
LWEVTGVAENTQPSSPGRLQADPEKLTRFAADLDDLIVMLERVRTKESDAALFRSPSLDPVTRWATDSLAGDAAENVNTPVGVVASIIKQLTEQVEAAKLAARDYADAERQAVERLRAAEERPT